jgi:hypothetical protein
MASNEAGEGAVLERIEEALKQAVMDNPDLDWDYGSKIKKQKYTDTAVDHFTPEGAEPPVTRSWFKYGRSCPAAPSGSNRVGTIDPGRIGGTQTPEIATLATEDLVHFFKHQLDTPKLNEENWFAKDLSFLETYYRHRAPEWLEPIYQANIQFRYLFWNVKRDIQNLMSSHEGAATSLAMFGGSSQTVDYYEQGGRLAANLQIELSKHEVFDPAVDTMTAYTDLVEDVLMELSGIGEEDLTQEHLEAIRELQTFYDEMPWEHVAFIMSLVTAEGPNSSEIKDLSRKNLDQIEREFPSKLDVLRATCADAGLTPDVSAYPSHDDETQDIIDDVAETVDGERN